MSPTGSDGAAVGSSGGSAEALGTEQQGAAFMIILEGGSAVPPRMREPVVRPDHEADNGLAERIHAVDVEARFRTYAGGFQRVLEQAPDTMPIERRCATILNGMNERYPDHPHTNRLLVRQLRRVHERPGVCSPLFAPVTGRHVEALIAAMARQNLRGMGQHRSTNATSKGKVRADTRAFVSVGAQHQQMIYHNGAGELQTGWRFESLPPTLQLQVLFLFESIGGIQAKVHVNLTGTVGLQASGWRAAYAHTPHADGQRNNDWRYCMAIGAPMKSAARDALFLAIKEACERDYTPAREGAPRVGS